MLGGVWDDFYFLFALHCVHRKKKKDEREVTTKKNGIDGSVPLHSLHMIIVCSESASLFINKNVLSMHSMMVCSWSGNMVHLFYMSHNLHEWPTKLYKALYKGLQSFTKRFTKVCKALQRFDIRSCCDTLCVGIVSTYVGYSMFPSSYNKALQIFAKICKALQLLSRPFMQLMTHPKTKNIVYWYYQLKGYTKTAHTQNRPEQ